MTEQEYWQNVESIALAVWESSTGNGQDLAEDLWDSHMQNCRAAAHGEWHEEIGFDAWLSAVLARFGA